jgi:hypothetical protein
VRRAAPAAPAGATLPWTADAFLDSMSFPPLIVVAKGGNHVDLTSANEARRLAARLLEVADELEEERRR